MKYRLSYVLMSREVLDSKLWQLSSFDFKLACYLIIMANTTNKDWVTKEGIVLVKRGEFITSRSHLIEALKGKYKESSDQKIRTSLHNLEKVDFLTKVSTSTYTHLTMPKYDMFQNPSRYTSTKSSTKPQPSPNQVLTTTKECNNVISKDYMVKDEAFDRFWSSYPRRTAKHNAIKAWKRLVLGNGLLDKILSAIETHKQSKQWLNGIIPHPATWLNQHRWEDEISEGIQCTKELMDLKARMS
jgi:hypothetical protein